MVDKLEDIKMGTDVKKADVPTANAVPPATAVRASALFSFILEPVNITNAAPVTPNFTLNFVTLKDV